MQKNSIFINKQMEFKWKLLQLVTKNMLNSIEASQTCLFHDFYLILLKMWMNGMQTKIKYSEY